MITLFCRIFLGLLLLAAPGCASREKKSTAQIHEGDGPSIKYLEERETAGGPVGGR